MNKDQRRAAALKAAATRRNRQAGIRTPDLTATPVTNPVTVKAFHASLPQPPTTFAFGELTTGRWGINPGDDVSTWGVCFKCGAKRPAINLVYRVMPFNRGEGWACDRTECLSSHPSPADDATSNKETK